MATEVYVDLLFLINFSMDYLCLYICARILHRKMNLLVMVVAAALGGAHSIVSLLLGFEGVSSLLIDIGICIIMCAIVFSEKARPIASTLLCSFLFTGISMMTGGAMTAIFNLLNKLDLPIDTIEEDGISPYLFIILAVISGIITLRGGDLISKRSSVTTCTLKVKIKGREATFKALSDSGNLARDPLGNNPIIIVDKALLSTIVDISFFDQLASGKAPDSIPYKNTRIVPIKTAGGTSLLVAISPDKLTVELYDAKNKKDISIDIEALVAPSALGDIGEGCNAVIPADILKF